MTTLFTKADDPEHQQNAKAILALHVLWRGAPLGTIVAIPIATGVSVLRGPRTMSNFTKNLLLKSSRGVVWGAALSSLALAGRMWGREPIEWQDRTWRLLENKGQVEVDNWILTGAGVGAVAGFVAARRGRLPPEVQARLRDAIIGSAGLGSVVGTTGYVGYRHGLHGGKFEE